MFGDEIAEIKSLRPFPLHGLTYWDVVVKFDDGRTEDARLGPEGVSQGVQPGDRVLVKKVAMMIVGLEPQAT